MPLVARLPAGRAAHWHTLLPDVAIESAITQAAAGHGHGDSALSQATSHWQAFKRPVVCQCYCHADLAAAGAVTFKLTVTAAARVGVRVSP